MSLPNTYMLGAPSDADNPFGAPLSAHELMKGLRMCNVNLHAPLPDAYDTWFPGKAQGMTALWLGQPSTPGSKKICAFHLGVMPEFTQVGPDGEIIQRGWRAVLRKAIAARATTTRTVNRVFKIDIDTDGEDASCVRCRIEGRITKADSAGGVCSLHAAVNRDANRITEQRKEQAWLESLSPEKRSDLMGSRKRISSLAVRTIPSSPSPKNQSSAKGRLLAAR